MPYSVTSDEQALTGTDRDPTPAFPLTTAQRELYRGLLKGLPPTAPLTTAILGLAATLAVALDEIDQCNQTLGRLKRLVVKGKPHPLLAVRHAASLRVASLSSRLRLLPTLDQREIARAAKFNSRFDGGQETGEARELEKVRRADGSIDWQATAALADKKGSVQ